MLPRVAPTTGVSQPSPALPAGAAADAAATPPASAAALANLRAEVLLRLLETMLKHMPRTAEPNPGRELLEALLTALKAMPDGEGGNARKLADIITRLPPELRPSVEKLIGTVLSAMPTRSLVEIVRNPNGPEAQKLANLLATSLQPADPAAGERQQKPVGLTAQQLAAVGRHGPQQAMQVLGDARALQTALKRIFDLEGGSKPRAMTGQASAPSGDAEHAVSSTGNTAARAEPRLPNPAARATDQRPADAAQSAIRHQGGAEDAQAASPTLKREEIPARAPISNAAGQALARSVLQAVARDVPPAQLMQAVAQLMENLSPEEASFIRALLEHPFDPAIEQELAQIASEHAEEAAGKPHLEAGEPEAATPHPSAEQDEATSAPQARAAAQSAAMADALPERLPAAAIPREGVPLAFVPYLPAEEDIAWPESREAGEDEATGEDDEAGEEDGDAPQEDQGGGEPEPESPDMARRREKTAEMVGVIEPGLVFYQKLGDYWT
ncbi:flagellar biosynthesis protein FlhF [Shinella zoogloeoides]|uniref:Uncharacterized protein n=1 Tax=Shinella zoogloeoides TaxID=352475 RepID=A0A6N8TEA2_SHIZO|nr:hypothetical protein [Shinella zoogloeoides]MXO01597.1 hypothetical protein [Shinella zoogloeoides]UEX82048.1 hypothetical protein K8M09_01750 [Shinella zoogloeoides]